MVSFGDTWRTWENYIDWNRWGHALLLGFPLSMIDKFLIKWFNIILLDQNAHKQLISIRCYSNYPWNLFWWSNGLLNIHFHELLSNHPGHRETPSNGPGDGKEAEREFAAESGEGPRVVSGAGWAGVATVAPADEIGWPSPKRGNESGAIGWGWSGMSWPRISSLMSWSWDSASLPSLPSSLLPLVLLAASSASYASGSGFCFDSISACQAGIHRFFRCMQWWKVIICDYLSCRMMLHDDVVWYGHGRIYIAHDVLFHASELLNIWTSSTKGLSWLKNIENHIVTIWNWAEDPYGEAAPSAHLILLGASSSLPSPSPSHPRIGWGKRFHNTCVQREQFLDVIICNPHGPTPCVDLGTPPEAAYPSSPASGWGKAPGSFQPEGQRQLGITGV